MTVDIEVLGPAPLDSAAEQVVVPTRDGVRLATDVYLPDGAGRVPAVLVRLPYDKCGRYTFMPALAPYFTERGYAFVVQDVRGKFRSGGETLAFAHEALDGYDTIEWVAGQRWCDGRVGMWGDSYYGFTQWAAVASGHPALKAIVPRVTSADLKLFCGGWRDGVAPLYGADYLAHYWLDENNYEFVPDWSTRPLVTLYDEAFAAIGARSASFDIMAGLRGPRDVFDFKVAHPFSTQKVPALHSVGWFDNISPYSFRDYEALLARPEQRHLQYLVGDATDHENYHLRYVPITEKDDHDADDKALARMIPVYVGPGLDFFDAFLKGAGDAGAAGTAGAMGAAGAAGSVPRAAWFLGHDAWRTSPAWPPPEACELRLYLAGAEHAAEGPGGGELLPSAGPTEHFARWVHDPGDLVPSAPTNPFDFLREYPDEREVQSRPDVLTFTTEPAPEPLDLVGPVAAVVTVGSSGPSMHVHAKLCEVDPDGAAHMLLRGEALVRGEEFGRPVVVTLSHTAHRVRPGRRLRLHIASSDFPLYLPHPGSDEDPWLAEGGTRNEQSLACGGGAASYLRLTVLPAGRRDP